MKRNAARLNLITREGISSPINIANASLGSGGDANIYQIGGQPETVAKIYHDPSKDPRRPDKIRAMLANPPNMSPIWEGRISYIQIAWPTAMIEDNRGNFVGYTMPFVDLKRSTVLENLLARKTRRVMKLPDFYGYRAAAAANLAALVDALHACGHHIIDLKPVNLNVYLDKFYIALLDCDGLSIQGERGKRFHAHQYTDGYIAPEALQGKMRPQDLGEIQDRFALAVILFQLLNRGIHPYQGVPRKGTKVPPTNSERIQRNLYAYGKRPNTMLGPSPWSIHNFLEDETRELFDLAFSPNSAKKRPSADAWRRHLQKLSDPNTGLLKKCSRKTSHGMFTKGCGFCHVEQVVKKGAHPKRKSKREPKHNRSPKQTITPVQTNPQGTGAAAQAGGLSPKDRMKRILIVAAVLLGIVATVVMITQYTKKYNIHNVIARNDLKAFQKRTHQGYFDWGKISTADLREAVSFDDLKLFNVMIRDMPHVPYDRYVFFKLMDKSRIEYLRLYLLQLNKFPADIEVIRGIIPLESQALIDLYSDKATGIHDMFSQIFLKPNIADIKTILRMGANPNTHLEDDDYVQKLHKNKPYYPNHIDPTGGEDRSHPMNALCRRYSGPFKAPGSGDIEDLKSVRTSLKFGLAGREAPNPAPVFGRSTRLSMSHYVYPLTIALLNEDLDVCKALVAAGAKNNSKIPNHESIYDLAPNSDFYKTLNSNWKTSNNMEQAIVENNPRKLTAALDNAKKEGVSPNRKRLRLMATRYGSVRCLDLLLERWKGRHGLNSLEAVFNAYRSRNPLMVAYYVKHIISYDRRYTRDQIHKALPHKEKLWVFFRYDVVSELANRKIKKIKIGECLLGMARQDKAWSMAFVLEDHKAKWTDLHLAVLSEDTATVRNLLQLNPGRIEERDAKGRTPLGLAAQYACRASYDALMAFNPKLTAKDNKGNTPLRYAVRQANVPMVEDLLQRGDVCNSDIGAECIAATRISEENEEIADHLNEMVSTYDLGGVPDQIFSTVKNVHRTRDLIQSGGGTKEADTGSR